MPLNKWQEEKEKENEKEKEKEKEKQEERCCITHPWVVGGGRRGETVIYFPGVYPLGCIGPVSYIWKEKGEGEGEEGERELLLWVHPSIYDVVFELLGGEIDGNEEKERGEDKMEVDSGNVKIISLKDTLSFFEIRGPLSHPLLLRTLLPVGMEEREGEKENEEEKGKGKEKEGEGEEGKHPLAHSEKMYGLWEGLGYVRTTQSLPTSCVLALQVSYCCCYCCCYYCCYCCCFYGCYCTTLSLCII